MRVNIVRVVMDSSAALFLAENYFYLSLSRRWHLKSSLFKNTLHTVDWSQELTMDSRKLMVQFTRIPLTKKVVNIYTKHECCLSDTDLCTADT